MHPLVEALQASTPEHLRPFVSLESYIDQALRTLVTSYVKNNGFTPKEKQDYDELTMKRMGLMRPRLPRRRAGLCAHLHHRLHSLS
jgi:hypothetical protein